MLCVIIESLNSADTLRSPEAFRLVLDFVILVFRKCLWHNTQVFCDFLEILIEHFMFYLQGPRVLTGERRGTMKVSLLMHFLQNLLWLKVNCCLELRRSILKAIILQYCRHFSCAHKLFHFLSKRWVVKLVICKHLLDILC